MAYHLSVSDIEEMLPLDPKLPKVISLKFHGKKIPTSSYAEFDTIESAREWRKDIQGLSFCDEPTRCAKASTGAIFLYKHSQRELLVNSGAEDTDGVRISIPLSQIDRIRVGENLKTVLTLEISMAIADAGSSLYAKIDLSHYAHMFRFVTIRSDVEWNRLQHHIDVAKARKSAAKTGIVVDFGPLSCTETSDNDFATGAATNEESKVESKVRRALSFTNEADIWSGCCSDHIVCHDMNSMNFSRQSPY